MSAGIFSRAGRASPLDHERAWRSVGSVNAPGVIAAKTLDQLLADARARLQRVEPSDALAAMRAGALLIDIRSEAERSRDGLVPGAVFIPRNVLEWRCDPTSSYRAPRVDGRARRLILMCNEGYQSSLAAATLHELGLTRATDLIGGLQGWRAAARR